MALTTTGLSCDLPERVKVTIDSDIFLERVSAKVLNFWDTIAVRTSVDWVWLAEAMDPFTKIPDRLK